MSRRRILTLTLAVYSVMAATGLGWAAFRGRPLLLVHPAPWLELGPLAGHGASLGAGAAVALLTLALTRLWVPRFRWARELHVAFRDTLGDALDRVTVPILALCSGIGEELFFRGALQPSIGLVATSVIFGLVHLGPDRRFWPWTAWAVAMGFVLGAIHEATGSLAGPIVAHVWINHANLHYIAAFDPRAPDGDDRRRGPRLVGRRERR
ncbi:MAG TPA: CPBP family intramembrane glutamic endopeptidase [Sandaracinaceae bacterium LLY-WYZ-13_1]|nr:CPBP family intramembrane glutamic endopeptidase [Sandaracinaceae bacterium LLY-WYZ-13_1]